MKFPAIPSSETERLSALWQMDLLDTPSEEPFDTLVELASHIFEAPMAYMSFVDAHRQWFKATYDMDFCETPREFSFCGHAILEDRPMVIEDARKDERFCDNPYVVEEPKIRFYAGAQIRTFDGHAVGTLCVIDFKPRKPSKEQVQMLEKMARLAANLVENRRRENLLARKWRPKSA
jgi:GAF domain-containing protein